MYDAGEKWVFHDNLTFDNDYHQYNGDFISNNIRYSFMNVQTSDTKILSYNEIFAFDFNTWRKEEYKTVRFRNSVEQTTDFYQWLSSNADLTY